MPHRSVCWLIWTYKKGKKWKTRRELEVVHLSSTSCVQTLYVQTRRDFCTHFKEWKWRRIEKRNRAQKSTFQRTAFKVGHCTVSMSYTQHLWRPQEGVRYAEPRAMFLFFSQLLNCWENAKKMNKISIKAFTRAKKLVWQSSRLAPLVCKFGWAIGVGGGGDGGLHTQHT